MKFKMEERFLPIDYKKLLYTEMFNLKQYNKLVEEYTKEFRGLSIWNQVRES